MKKPRSMKNRYGFDTLFFAVTALCLGIVILTYTVLRHIPHISAHGILSVTGLIMIINLSRVFSTQISKREAENIKFTLFVNKLMGKGGKIGNYVMDNKGYTPLSQLKSARPDRVTCKCGSKLDIPKGSGSNIIVCPKCGKRMSVKLP